MEEDFIGSQGTNRAVGLEEKEEEKREDYRGEDMQLNSFLITLEGIECLVSRSDCLNLWKKHFISAL